MKKTLSLITLLIPLTAICQNNKFVIKGKLGHYNAPAKAYFWYLLNGVTYKDSSVVNNGEFKFSGEIVDDSPTFARFVFDEKGEGIRRALDNQQFWLEPGKITVMGDKLMADAKVSGTQANEDNTIYKDQLKAAGIIRNDITVIQDTLDLRKLAVDKAFTKKHPSSFISFVIAQNYIYSRANPDYKKWGDVYGNLSQKWMNTESGKSTAHMAVVLKSTAIGEMAPDFSEPDFDGNQISLSSFRGKYVLVDFWASWCMPCREENPNVIRAYDKYKNKGFTVLGVSFDEDGNKAAWEAAVKKDGLPWIHISDLKGYRGTAGLLYGIRSIPSNFLIDPQGRIIARDLRGNDLDTALEKYLGKI